MDKTINQSKSTLNNKAVRSSSKNRVYEANTIKPNSYLLKDMAVVTKKKNSKDSSQNLHSSRELKSQPMTSTTNLRKKSSEKKSLTVKSKEAVGYNDNVNTKQTSSNMNLVEDIVYSNSNENEVQLPFNSKTDEINNYKETINSCYTKITGSMRVIEDLRKKIDELKQEENIHKNKNNLQRLIQKLKDDMSEISLNIKNNEIKADKLLNNTPIVNNKIGMSINPETFSTKPIATEFSENISEIQNKNKILSRELDSFKQKFVEIDMENTNFKHMLKERPKSTNKNTSKINNFMYNNTTNSLNYNTSPNNFMPIKSYANLKGGIPMSNSLSENYGLQLLNEELSRELDSYKRKFADVELENVHLKNQITTKSNSKARPKNYEKFIDYEYRTGDQNSPQNKSKDFQEKEQFLKQLSEKNITLERNLNSLESKLESSNRIIAELASKTKSADKNIQQLKNENTNLQKYKVFVIGKEKIKVHGKYKVNSNNNFMLISDPYKKIFTWVNLFFSENKILLDLNNEMLREHNVEFDPTDFQDLNVIDNENKILKRKMNEIESEFEETKKCLLSELEVKEKILSDLKNEIDKFKFKNSPIDSNIDNLKKKIVESETKIKELTNMIKFKDILIEEKENELESNLSEYRSDLERVMKEKSLLQNSLNEQCNLTGQLRKSTENYEKMYSNLKAEKENLLEKFDQLSKNKNWIENNFSSINEAYITIMGDTSKLDKTIQQWNTEIEEIKTLKIKEISELEYIYNNKISDLNSKIKEALDILNHKNNELVDYKLSLSNKTNELKKLKEVVEEMKLILEEKEKLIINLAKHSNQEEAITYLRDENENIKKENEELKTSSQIKNENENKLITDLNQSSKQILSMKIKLEEQIKTLKDLNMDNEKLKDKITNLENDKFKFNKLNSELEFSNQEYERKYFTLEAKLKELDQTLENKIKELQISEEKSTKDKSLLMQTENQVLLLQEELKDTKLKIEKAYMSTKSYSDQLKKIEDNLLQVQKENVHLKSCLNTKESELKSLSKELNTLKDSTINIDNQQQQIILTKTKEYSELSRKYEKLEESEEELSNYKNKLEIENEKYKNEIKNLNNNTSGTNNQLAAFRIKLENYESMIITLENSVKSKSIIEKELNEIIKELKENLNIKDLKMNEYIVKLQHLNNQVEEYSQIIDKLKQHTDVLEKEKSEINSSLNNNFKKIIDEKEKTQQELRIEINNLASELVTLSDQTQEYKKKFQEYTNELLLKNQEIEKQDQQVAKLNDSLINFKNVNNELENEINLYKSKLVEMKTLQQDYQIKIDEKANDQSLNSKREQELMNEIEQYKLMLSRNEKKLELMNSKCAEFNENIELISELKFALKREVEEKENKDKTIENYKKLNKQLQDEINKLSQKCKESEANEELEFEIADLKETLINEELEKAKLTKIIEEYKEKNNVLQEDIQTLNKKCLNQDKLQSEIAQLKDSLDASIKDNLISNATIEDFKRVHEQLTNKTNELTKIKEELESNLLLMNNSLASVTQRNEKYQSEIKLLKEKITQEQENGNKREEYYIETINKLNNEVEEKDLEIERDEKIISENSLKHNQYTEEILNLKVENKKLREELDNNNDANNINNLNIAQLEALKEELLKSNTEKMETKETLINLQIKLEENRIEYETELKGFSDIIEKLNKEKLELKDEYNNSKVGFDEKIKLYSSKWKELEDKLKYCEDLVLKKDKELEELKTLNNKLVYNLEEIELQKNSPTKDLVSYTAQNYKEEEIRDIMDQVYSLKEVIISKEDYIHKLEVENENYKTEIEKVMKSNDDLIENKSRYSVNVSSFGNYTNEDFDAKKTKEKILKYKTTIDNYKQTNDLQIQQLSLLKGEIKNYKLKLEELTNFSGRISDYEDFKNTVNKVLEICKPKKKEHEELVKKIKDHLALDISHNDNNNQDKKKGFFTGLFTNKKK